MDDDRKGAVDFTLRAFVRVNGVEALAQPFDPLCAVVVLVDGVVGAPAKGIERPRAVAHAPREEQRREIKAARVLGDPAPADRDLGARENR